MKLSEYFSSKTDKDLRSELRGLNDAIEKVECFGVNDILLRDAIEKELARRKVEARLESLTDILYDLFPARHYAHGDIFRAIHTLEERIKENFPGPLTKV